MTATPADQGIEAALAMDAGELREHIAKLVMRLAGMTGIHSSTEICENIKQDLEGALGDPALFEAFNEGAKFRS